MTWDERLLSDADLRQYLPTKNITNFRDRACALLEQQRQTWPMLKEALADFDEVQCKELMVKGSRVIAQFNPNRIVSTSARIDAETIRNRPCFLCLENLPPEEKGIAFDGDFVALCNPFPILPCHLVISSRRHIPQAIGGNIETMLRLAEYLGEGWLTLYNGPKCGASAPDHMHFQACASESVPALLEIGVWEKRSVKTAHQVEVFTLDQYRVNLIVARGSDSRAIARWFDYLVSRFTAMVDTSEEPMLNLVAAYESGRWTLIIIPRGKHRPDCYYAEGDNQLLVSPAALDLAGFVIVPQPDHFARIGVRDIEAIYEEVTLDGERFGRLINI